MRAEIAQARYTYLRIRAVAETLACSEVHVRELVKGGAFTFPGLRAPINVGKPGGGRFGVPNTSRGSGAILSGAGG